MKLKTCGWLFFLVAACAGPTTHSKHALSGSERERAQELVATGDAAWAQRAQRTELESAIEAWKQALAIDSADWKTWTRLVRAYYWLAEGYVAFDVGADATYLSTHEAGMKAGEQALRNYSDKTRRQFDLGAKLEELVPLIDKDGVPAMYWYASSFGRWAKKQGTAKAVLYKDTIRKVQERARELDENYFYAAPLRYFGAFYAFAPPFAGGDVEKGKQYFEEAIKRYPAYLGTRVLYADTYAAKVQDEDLFRRQLRLVIDAPTQDDAASDIAWENQVAKQQAQTLLGKASELF